MAWDGDIDKLTREKVLELSTEEKLKALDMVLDRIGEKEFIRRLIENMNTEDWIMLGAHLKKEGFLPPWAEEYFRKMKH